MTENYDGQGKSLEEETYASMRVVALVMLVSFLFVMGALGLLVWAMV